MSGLTYGQQGAVLESVVDSEARGAQWAMENGEAEEIAEQAKIMAAAQGRRWGPYWQEVQKTD